MRKSVVLDSYILLVLFEQHRGWTDVVDLFLEALKERNWQRGIGSFEESSRKSRFTG